MSTSNRAGGTTATTNATSASTDDRPQPPIRKRRNKWLQDDRSHLIGIARRKGEKNPKKYNVELDPEFARYAPKGWNAILPPLDEKKKKKKKPPSTISSGSDSEKGKGGWMQKLMFWKKKKAKSSPPGTSGTGAGTTTRISSRS